MNCVYCRNEDTTDYRYRGGGGGVAWLVAGGGVAWLVAGPPHPEVLSAGI